MPTLFVIGPQIKEKQLARGRGGQCAPPAPAKMLERNSTRGRFTNSISGRIGRLVYFAYFVRLPRFHR